MACDFDALTNERLEFLIRDLLDLVHRARRRNSSACRSSCTCGLLLWLTRDRDTREDVVLENAGALDNVGLSAGHLIFTIKTARQRSGWPHSDLRRALGRFSSGRLSRCERREQ